MTISEQKSEKIRTILQKIEDTTKLEGLAVITRDGVRVASSASVSVDADMLSAASAAMISTGEMATTQLNYGNLSDIIIRGDNGHILLTRSGPNHMLVAASKDTTQLGLNLGILRRYAQTISEMMRAAPEIPSTPRIPAATAIPAPPPPKPVTVTATVRPKPAVTPEITASRQVPEIKAASPQVATEEISGDERGAIFEALRALGLEDMVEMPSAKKEKKTQEERI